MVPGIQPDTVLAKRRHRWHERPSPVRPPHLVCVAPKTKKQNETIQNADISRIYKSEPIFQQLLLMAIILWPESNVVPCIFLHCKKCVRCCFYACNQCARICISPLRTYDTILQFFFYCILQTYYQNTIGAYGAMITFNMGRTWLNSSLLVFFCVLQMYKKKCNI